MQKLKCGSLFSGYGGLDLAIEAVFGAELAWLAEFDPAPSKIMARHWPDAPNYGDVTTVDWASAEPVDIISGGSPCQDVSAAGRRAGMNEGTRSNLWVAMREAIATIKPTYVVWENVRGAHSARAHSAVESEPGLLGEARAANLRATGRVLGDLAGLGYDAQWRTVSASSIGAPHKRERVFVLAWKRDSFTPNSDGGRNGRRDDPSRTGKRAKSNLATLLADGPSNGPGPARPIKLLPTVTTSDTNGVGIHGRGGLDLRTTVSRLPGTRVDFGQFSAAVERWELVAGRQAPSPTELSPRGKHRLSEHFTEWMMGLPAGWICDTDGINRNDKIKAAGNGVVPQQAIAALTEMLTHLASVELEAAA